MGVQSKSYKKPPAPRAMLFTHKQLFQVPFRTTKNHSKTVARTIFPYSSHPKTTPCSPRSPPKTPQFFFLMFFLFSPAASFAEEGTFALVDLVLRGGSRDLPFCALDFSGSGNGADLKMSWNVFVLLGVFLLGSEGFCFFLGGGVFLSVCLK